MSSTDAQLFPLKFQAGFHRESTRYAEEGRWYDGDKVRFREGRPENMRGWLKRNSTQFEGTARDLLLWTDNNTQKLAAFGTEKKLYVYDNDTITDITPIVSTTVLTSAFGTVDGSPLVSVSSASHGRTVGDFVYLSATATIGTTILLQDTYEVVTVTDSHTFVVSVGAIASSTEVSVGEGEAQFLLETGSSNAVQGLGYGAGVYNAGTSTTGVRAWNIAASSSNIVFLPSQWSLDNFGEDMVACRRGGRIYYWDRDAATTPQRATLVTASPSVNDFIVFSPTDRHLISLGCTGVAAPYSPTRVRWPDQNNIDNWTPSVSSTAGEIDITDGTRIVGGVRSRNQINFWTDKAMFALQYVGIPSVFNVRQVGSNCGLVGPHAAVDYDGRAFWMSDSNFYVFDGQVRNLRSSIRRYVYNNLKTSQLDKVYAGVNSEFKEIIWLYPSADGSGECDAYAIFNPEEGYWVYGTTKWTTFKDRHVFDNTITTGSDGYIYDNEPEGMFTGDGEAISSYVESADFDLEEGLNIMFVDRILPDFQINDGQITFTVTTKQYPTGPETVKGPYTITDETRKIDLRARGRQARVRVSTASEDTEWRMGAVRMSAQIDGMR